MVADVIKPGEGKEKVGRSMSPPRKSPTCPHLKDLTTQCMLQTFENWISAVALEELPQELLATPHQHLQRPDHCSHLNCCFLFFL